LPLVLSGKRFLIVLFAWLLLTPGAQAADLVHVRMAEVLRSYLYVPMYVALTKGFAKDEGLDVTMTTYGGGDRVGAALISGQADFGLAGPEVAVYLFNGESPDKPVMFCSLTGTDGFFLGSRKKIDNFQWSMLNSAKILGHRPGGTPELYFEYVLKQHGVDAAAIKGIVTNIGVPARDGAWISGAGEFGIFIEPNATQLERTGSFHIIASIGKEVGRADYTIFMAKRSWIEAHPDVAQKWTNAVARAQQWVRTASSSEIAEAVKSYFPGISVEDAVSLIDRYRNSGAPIWTSSTVIDKAGLARAQDIMVQGGVLTSDKIVPYEKFVDPKFGEAADKRFGADAVKVQ
jgi:NitT/TauT family transport system substrate-binding protein